MNQRLCGLPGKLGMDGRKPSVANRLHGEIGTPCATIAETDVVNTISSCAFN